MTTPPFSGLNEPPVSRGSARSTLLERSQTTLFVRSHGRLDLTKPAFGLWILNERCNLRARVVTIGRLHEYKTNVADRVEAALGDLKSFLGVYFTHFSGGEPLLRRSRRHLGYCRDSGHTRGIDDERGDFCAMSGARAGHARLFNLNISLDGATPATHDAQRGVRGTYDKRCGQSR